MRFIHIADLHLGKQMNDLSLLPDQEYILNQIVSIASEEKADAVLVAGDVYQRASPQAEAMALFDGFVSRLAAQGKRVFVISGNHDSAQRVGRDTLRYAGSPLKYSFSEAGHRKSVAIVDVPARGEIAVRTVPLRPLHEVRLLEGTLDALMNQPYSEDYLWVTLRDELPPPDARVTLSVNFPNMLKFSIVNSRTKQDVDVLATQAMENKTVLELFDDFYRLQNNDQAPGEAHRQILQGVLEELEERA